MRITHKLELDFLEKDGVPKLCAVQSDANTRVVEVTLLSGGKEWTPAGATASVAFRNLKDGHKGWYDKLPNGDAACTVNGNVVTAILAPAVLSGDGEVQAAIVFQDADLNQLATFGFSILVEKNPAAGSELRNDYYAYSTMEAVSQAVDAMLDSLEDTKVQLGQLVNEVNEAVAQVSQEAGPAIVCEETGEAVAVADASDRPLHGLTIYGKTTQAGTPSPSNPVPLVNVGSGGSIGVTVAGKNLLPYPYAQTTQTMAGVTYTDNGDGTITANGTATGTSYIDLIGFATPSLLYLPVGEYHLSGCPSGGGSGVYGILVRDVNNGSVCADYGYGASLNVTQELSEGGLRIFIRVYSGRTASNLVFKPMLVAGTSATAYEPYKEIQTLALSTPNGLPAFPVTSGGNYTDASGQAWICDEIDLARGVYVQRVRTLSLSGKETWYNANNEMWLYITEGITAPGGRVCACTHYPAQSRYETNNNKAVSGYQGISVNADRLRIVDNVQFNGDVDALKTWLAEQAAAGNPVTVVYLLATPTETPLDADTLAAYAALHSNKPNTTVLNDAGAGQKLAYVADTKTYIDNKFTEVTNAIVAMGGAI